MRSDEVDRNPFNLILLVVALVTYVTDVLMADQPDWATVSIIVSLVVFSSLVAFVQGERSNSAAESLAAMISNTADVWRDDGLVEIPFEDVVPGDIVRLSAGDMLPADVRFLTTKDTFVAQSVLTGESQPVEKLADSPDDIPRALTDLQNIGFLVQRDQRQRGRRMFAAGTTPLRLLAGLSSDRAKTSFGQGVTAVSRLLIRMMLVTVRSCSSSMASQRTTGRPPSCSQSASPWGSPRRCSR